PNYMPCEEPAGGPNFFQFGDDVLYEIKIDNDGDARADVVYQFRFKTTITNPSTFLYNTGPITALDSPSWNLRQTYSVTRVLVGHNDENDDDERERRVLGADLASPPVRIGPRSTPDYPALADAAIHPLPNGVKVFAGQRDEGFFVDVGSIFDLGALRPFANLHLLPLPAMDGKDGTKGFNVHTIALQVPKTELTRGNSVPLNVMDPRSVIGVWATASRQRDPDRCDLRLPERQRPACRGHAPPHPRDPAGLDPERVRPPRRRHRRLPQRPARRRQRRRDRAPRGRRCHAASGAPELHRRRCGGAAHRRHRERAAVPLGVPVSRASTRGLRAQPRLADPSASRAPRGPSGSRGAARSRLARYVLPARTGVPVAR